jgi:hypothetical protein
MTYSCAVKLIERSPLLQTMAATYNRRNDLAKKWGQAVRTQANNERSTQIRVMKNTWMNNNSLTSFTKTTSRDGIYTIKLSSSLLEEQLSSVQELRSLIRSPSMYTNSIVYHFFCKGLESGNFKNKIAQPVSSISDLITPAHEAHFRLELWYHLASHDFRHAISKSHANDRIRHWQDFLPMVFKDRQDNEVLAAATRMANNNLHGHGEVDDSNDIGDDSANAMYWE